MALRTPGSQGRPRLARAMPVTFAESMASLNQWCLM
jgi:hypothetical protein